MHKASLKDFLLLFVLAGIWGSAFFNIKIASESYTPMALAFGRIFFAAIVMLIYCWIRKISIEAFGENWLWYATIGFVNLVLPFFFYFIWNSKSSKQSSCYLDVHSPYSSNNIGSSVYSK